MQSFDPLAKGLLVLAFAVLALGLFLVSRSYLGLSGVDRAHAGSATVASPSVGSAAAGARSDDPSWHVASSATAPHHYFSTVLIWTTAPSAHVLEKGVDLGEVPYPVPRPQGGDQRVLTLRAPGRIDREIVVWAQSPNKVEVDLTPQVRTVASAATSVESLAGQAPTVTTTRGRSKAAPAGKVENLGSGTPLESPWVEGR